MARQLDMALFSKKLKEARTDRNMTQKDLSDLSGISTVMLSAYERSNTEYGKNPALNNIYAIATALEVSIDWLCGLSDDMNVGKDKSDVDIETFLYSFVKLIDVICLTYGERFPCCPADEVDTWLIKKSFKKLFNKDYMRYEGTPRLIDFFEEYLNTKLLLKQTNLPNEMETAIVKSIVDKYKKYDAKKLFKGYYLIGDDNANNSEA